MEQQEVDLEKIAEFMNSGNEKEISDIDKNEIENTLDFIDSSLEKVKKQTKDIKTPEDAEKQEITLNELTKMALAQMKKVNAKTDAIYDLFYAPILARQDRSDASKEALVETQRINVEMINAISALANAQAKVEAAKAKTATGNTGIFINTVSGKEAGISLHNIWQNTDDEDDE